MSSSTKTMLSARIQKAASKGQSIEFKPLETPPPMDTFENMFSAASGAHKDFANVHTINVLPNFVPLLCYIFFHVQSTLPLLEMTGHAKISAPTYAAYCLAVLYGHILICDTDVRQPPSHHAASFDQVDYKRRFLDYLRDLPVPQFMQPIVNQLVPAADELRPHIWFVPSPAGYSFRHHFGRLFPMSIFFTLHNVIAESPGNSPRHEIIAELLSRPLFKIENFYPDTASFTGSIGHYFSFGFKHNETVSYYDSRLYQSFSSLFNPVLFRDYQRRRTLATVSITSKTFESESHNAFDFMFGSSPNNCSEMSVIFDAISRAMKGSIPISGTLTDTFKNTSGSKIMSHGYSEHSLPTFTSSTLYPPMSRENLPVSIEPSEFAKHISFLNKPSSAAATDIPQPSAKCDTDESHKTTLSHVSWPFNLLSATKATTPKPNPDADFVIFNEKMHLYPKVQVLNYPDASTVDAWKVTAFGMVIEAFELDASTVAFPSIHIPNGVENSWFADSAIPLRYVSPAFRFGSLTDRSPQVLKRTNPVRSTRHPAASLLVNRTQVLLAGPAASVATPIIDSTLPGLTLSTMNTIMHKTLRFIGFNTVDARDHSSNADSIPGVTEGSLLVWSPYTYVGYTDNDYDEDSTIDYSVTRSYFITNLRTIFGTHFPLIELNNALDAMPVN